jgi:hypothetical protein
MNARQLLEAFPKLTKFWKWLIISFLCISAVGGGFDLEAKDLERKLEDAHASNKEEFRNINDTRSAKVEERERRQTAAPLPVEERRIYPVSARGDTRNHARYGSIRIEGQGLLSQAAIVEYIRQRNCNISVTFLNKLVGAYIREARKENINHDLAIAQMCYATNFLMSGRSDTFNYAGFNTATPGWSGRFSNMEQGVIAHIQHLKGYTCNVRKSDLIEPLADPRWKVLDTMGIRGTIDTLKELSKRWFPSNPQDYETGIISIINGMYRA